MVYTFAHDNINSCFMSKFKFIDQKDQIIQWFNEGKQYVEIAKLLNSDNIIKDAENVRRLVIHFLHPSKSNKRAVLTSDIQTKVLSYLNEGKTVPEIGDLLGINKATISSFLLKKNIRLNPNKGNVHYFDNINSYAKAYIVGFIAADGSLVKSKNGTTSLTITVKYEDRAVLEFIKSEIGNEHKLLEIVRPASYNKNKIIHHVRYAIADNNISNALNNLGIFPRKSLTMDNIITNIPIKFRDAFIIGYFDGDGSVTIRDGQHPSNRGILCYDYSLYIQIRGTKDFLLGICNHLKISTTHIHQNDSIPCLSFANKKDTYRFFQCYKNLPFYYERKYNKFLQRINHPSYDKYKQVQTISSSID